MMVEQRCSVLLTIVAVILIKIGAVHSIIGGHTALPGAAPYVVAVRGASGSPFICAGVLIKSDWVLTTANCVADKTASDLSVLSGSHRLLTTKKSILVTQIVSHPAYNLATGAHNMALLKLSEHTLLTARTNVVALNDASVASGIVTSFYGWGALAYGSTSYSNNLQTLFQRTISETDCRTSITNLATGDICALIQPGQAACTKDEGGPLINYSTGKLIGIYSYGTQCSGRLPDVFTDVYTHKSWIEATAI